MFVLPRTVKWRMKGRIFFRRLFGCAQISSIAGSYVVVKRNGTWAGIPSEGTEIVVGHKVEKKV